MFRIKLLQDLAGAQTYNNFLMTYRQNRSSIQNIKIFMYVRYIIMDIDQFQPGSDQGFFHLVLKLAVFKTFLWNLDYVQCVMIMTLKMTLTSCFIVINIMICENIYMRRYAQYTNILKWYLTQNKFNTVISSVFVKYTTEDLYKFYHKRHS